MINKYIFSLLFGLMFLSVTPAKACKKESNGSECAAPQDKQQVEKRYQSSDGKNGRPGKHGRAGENGEDGEDGEDSNWGRGGDGGNGGDAD